MELQVCYLRAIETQPQFAVAWSNLDASSTPRWEDEMKRNIKRRGERLHNYFCLIYYLSCADLMTPLEKLEIKWF